MGHDSSVQYSTRKITALPSFIFLVVYASKNPPVENQNKVLVKKTQAKDDEADFGHAKVHHGV
ncbi:predicted protein [Sclerotinia sclerotiorum 1980 UF-70]|uniref:Uncharacterized protein n=1 Tax=Sclerotinia sclerotiorum (strain ATCC 18683 / 1980 / Ss-1) TaxID=665079 RepID=A7ECB1_SCLS1|nr:predicted protein [Sclerotinia sclerotiorum 1980 UF-70]EDO00090.1 predicted protein [Sclerotinia sclerotiorum 1980 UF-70]